MSEPVQEAPRPKRGAPPTRGRRGARYGALQQVYSTLINPSSAQEMTLAALASEHLRQADRSYLQTLIHGVVEQREALEAQLSPLCDRGLAQLDAMEHALCWPRCTRWKSCILEWGRFAKLCALIAARDRQARAFGK